MGNVYFGCGNEVTCLLGVWIGGLLRGIGFSDGVDRFGCRRICVNLCNYPHPGMLFVALTSSTKQFSEKAPNELWKENIITYDLYAFNRHNVKYIVFSFILFIHFDPVQLLMILSMSHYIYAIVNSILYQLLCMRFKWAIYSINYISP